MVFLAIVFDNSEDIVFYLPPPPYEVPGGPRLNDNGKLPPCVGGLTGRGLGGLLSATAFQINSSSCFNIHNTR